MGRPALNVPVTPKDRRRLEELLSGGVQQVRVVLRDPETELSGSASQFIEVPDVAKGRLALSGIVLQKDDLILFERPFSGCFQSPEQDIRIFIKLLIC